MDTQKCFINHIKWMIVMGGILGMQCSWLVSKLAFFPPDIPALSREQIPANTQSVTITTVDRKELRCLLVASPGSSKILLYFHGNAETVGQGLDELQIISSMGMSVLGVEYRGFGGSTGSPSEKGIYRDADAAMAYANSVLGFTDSSIVILGRSIGSAAAMHIASKKSIAGLILAAPLTTGYQMARAGGFGIFSSLAGRSFDNLARIKTVSCPLLIIHGTADEVIPIRMGKELFDNAIMAEKKFAAIQGGHHNDLAYSTGNEYYGAIREFIKLFFVP